MFARSLLHLSPPRPPLLLLSTLDHSSSSSSSSHVISFDQVKIKGFGFGLSDLRRLKLSSSIRLKAMEDSGRSVIRPKGSGSEDPDEISGLCFFFFCHFDFIIPLFVGDLQMCLLILMDLGK